MNTTGLNLDPESYTSPPPLSDATSNYWNSALGPNYNSTNPGTGDLITDNNIPATQTVQYHPFLTNAIMCPPPVTLTNTTASVNVPPGTPVSFVVTITVAEGEIPFNAVSFTIHCLRLQVVLHGSLRHKIPVGFSPKFIKRHFQDSYTPIYFS
jgi:hypothetical protein